MRRLFQHRYDGTDFRNDEEWRKFESGEPVWRWRTPVICAGLASLTIPAYLVSPKILDFMLWIEDLAN